MTGLVKRETSVMFDIDKANDLFKICANLAKSPILKPELRAKPEAVFSIVLMAHELNIPPMQALTSMHFIQGRATLPTVLMLGLARARIPSLQIRWEMDHENKTVECFASRDGCAEYSSFWDMPRADAMGLTKRDQYQKQALTMLKWRATADVLRIIAPDVIMGIYGREEFTDFDGSEMKSDQQLLDEEHPIPVEETKVGPFYRIQYGKYRDAQLKDFDREGIEEIKAYLEKQLASKAARPWQDGLHSVICAYLQDYEHYEKLIPEEAEIVD